jgi:hypothetical protein
LTPPEFVRIDQGLSFYFHIIPLPRPFSVEWAGTLKIDQPGSYSLGLASVDDAELLLDDNRIVQSESRDTTFHPVFLSAGYHPIVVRYNSVNDYGQIYLRWIRPDGENEEIPADYLLPLPPSGEPLRGPLAPMVCP